MTLVLVAHGTRDPGGSYVIYEIADLIRGRLDGIRVEVAFADVRPPRLATVLSSIDGPAVVVPAFLATGYHVTMDIPAQAGPGVTITPPLGPAPALVAAAHDRLLAAGWRTGDPIVLAAAGSSDPRALADVRRAAILLGLRTASQVRIGYAATASPRIADVVAGTPGRVAVATWLLAPGVFHRTIKACGAATISDPIGAHPTVAELIARRYLEARQADKVETQPME